jgi:hypothetical protein
VQRSRAASASGRRRPAALATRASRQQHAASKLHSRLLRGQQTKPLLQSDAVLCKSKNMSQTEHSMHKRDYCGGGGGGGYLGKLVVGGEASGVGGGRGCLADGALLEGVNALARLVEMIKKMHYCRQ